jgi:O-6-methylguanine DNA methyltransferase
MRIGQSTVSNKSPNPKSPGLKFVDLVLSVVRRIPPGRVATYGDVAELAGRPRAWRAVGNIMRDCRDPHVPCHRVIASGGRLGGYGGNIGLKRELLKAEGIMVMGSRVGRFAELRWRKAKGKREKGKGKRQKGKGRR